MSHIILTRRDKEIVENVKGLISDILIAVYQPFWFAILLAVIFMFAYKQNKGVWESLKQWLIWFRKEKKFRKVFYLVFYSVLVLFRTLFERTLFENPLSNVLGEWSFYEKENDKIVFNAHVPENIIMLAPFILLLFWAYRDRIFKNDVTLLKVVGYSFVIGFLVSFTIESLQLLLHLGTWQLSDLFYNTVGGIMGGLIYYVCFKVKHIIKKQ